MRAQCADARSLILKSMRHCARFRSGRDITRSPHSQTVPPILCWYTYTLASAGILYTRITDTSFVSICKAIHTNILYNTHKRRARESENATAERCDTFVWWHMIQSNLFLTRRHMPDVARPLNVLSLRRQPFGKLEKSYSCGRVYEVRGPGKCARTDFALLLKWLLIKQIYVCVYKRCAHTKAVQTESAHENGAGGLRGRSDERLNLDVLDGLRRAT